MKKYLKKTVFVLSLFIGVGVFAQTDNGYDLPILDSMTSSENDDPVVWVNPSDIYMEENISPALDLSGELPKLDEMLQVYFGGVEDFVIEQELEAQMKENKNLEKSSIQQPLKTYPIDNGYDLPEMDSIDTK